MDNSNYNGKSSYEQIKSAQTMITISTIAAPISLIFGGVLLSSIALVCGIIGRNRLKRVTTANAHEAAAMQSAAKSVKMAIIMCVIALGLNLISAYTMYPAYMELLQSSGAGDLTLNPSGASTSVWG